MKKTLISLTLLSLLSGCALDGDDGQTGQQGEQGLQGEAGQTGQTGDKGDQGNTGAQGDTGAQGPQGESGTRMTGDLSAQLVGRAVLNVASPEGAAEIVAYHSASQRIFALDSSGDTPQIAVISAAQIDADKLSKDNQGVITNTNLSVTQTIAVSEVVAADANSLAIHGDMLAVAMARPTGQTGFVLVYNIAAQAPQLLKTVEVGYLPDMVTFNHDGSKILVANEGEPAGDYSVDPQGSIAIIAINEGQVADQAILLGFDAFNDQQAQLQAQGVVFANPTGRTIKGQTINTSVAMDLEPEYVTVSKDNRYAYVSLQENNALAIVDLSDNSLTIKGLGYKDWGKWTLDASDKDGGINLRSYPGLYGMYQPDSIATYQWQGANFIVTANEGDGREYFFPAADEAECTANGGLDFDEDDGCLAYTDEIRAKDLPLADNFAYLNNDNDDLGRLKVTTVMGDQDNDGQYENLYTYGARSFSIWDQNGARVFDSGDEIVRITTALHGAHFNNDEDTNEGDTRSDAKGAEPEALALGQIGERTYAFVGLERMGSILIYDVTNPFNVTFTTYLINRGLEEGADISGDLAPEGMTFVRAEHSPTNTPLLIVGNEISGSIAIWSLTQK
ncbi:choice-of-anchor I family protein [Pseudoalteromonas sp. OOF1S-7]|uniref:choice-of-anchor I family protein n=1 Tax=Pseudoalteromonas sp. OOF1S-7 TaxID=2917757 RepID=UPI001EF575F8|nr:choice-of-anchor I family protein [Pseudoalteromonas sp. OOF1S-7]MCG7533867.1 collagen-like protein [Pseudoalteromonas sp. OOF1S-7]